MEDGETGRRVRANQNLFATVPSHRAFMTSRKRLLPMIAPAAFLAALLAACSGEPADPRTEAAETVAGWAAPPRVEAVTRTASGLTVSGQASPGARVVLRGGDGLAFAASADDAGRFDIRMSAPAGDVLLTPETQTGQDAAPAPERLLIIAGGQGPMAMLAPGAPSRRLDGSGALGSVDSDGRMLALSGRGPAGQPVRLSLNGRPAAMPTADSAGRWTAVVGPAGAGRIAVGEAAYDYPGAVEGGAGAARAGAGWSIGWSIPAGGRQTTWLPD